MCPPHSSCSNTNYCKCEPNYLLNCSLLAYELSEVEQKVFITSDYTYFQIMPIIEDYLYV